MQINKELTNKYYERYIPCNCGDCRYFIKHIENEQSEICNYLKSLGINPLKPYELMPIYFEKERKIEYLDCAYVVIGVLEEDFEKEINNIKIYTCAKEKYPLLNIDEEYFLISFGPISMNYAYEYNRHFTFNDKIQIIKQAIDEVDPMGLLAMNCSKDEYIQEATIIANDIKIKKANFVKGKYIQEVFKKQFDEIVSMKKCNDIATRISIYLDIKDYFKYFEENEILKGRVSIDNYEITLKIHDYFIFKHKGYKAYLNDKFYCNIEEQDLIDRLCELAKDEDTIYIQYQHRHFGLNINYSGYFKKIKRSKYSYSKLRHKKDIELIFDSKGVIYSKKISNLPKEAIIELMFNESVNEPYEKLFYSPDKMKRLIVYKNDVGSYSYRVEKLTILEGEEIYRCGRHSIWEPQFGNCIESFYENMDDLLKDIEFEIKCWIEK